MTTLSYDDSATAAQNAPSRKRASASKVHLYAEFLGVDLKKHSYLYDLMEEGLRCPLPQGWKIRKLENDEDGNAVHEFFHEPSGKISHSHPMDEVFLERAQAVIRKHEAVVAAKRRGDLPTSSPAAALVNDSMSDNDGDDSIMNKNKNNKNRFRSSYRKPSSPASKRFRYFLYCALFATVIHFVVYQGVYKFIFEMGRESAAAKKVESQSKKITAETAKPETGGDL